MANLISQKTRPPSHSHLFSSFSQFVIGCKYQPADRRRPRLHLGLGGHQSRGTLPILGISQNSMGETIELSTIQFNMGQTFWSMEHFLGSKPWLNNWGTQHIPFTSIFDAFWTSLPQTCRDRFKLYTNRICWICYHKDQLRSATSEHWSVPSLLAVTSQLCPSPSIWMWVRCGFKLGPPNGIPMCAFLDPHFYPKFSIPRWVG